MIRLCRFGGMAVLGSWKYSVGRNARRAAPRAREPLVGGREFVICNDTDGCESCRTRVGTARRSAARRDARVRLLEHNIDRRQRSSSLGATDHAALPKKVAATRQ